MDVLLLLELGPVRAAAAEVGLEQELVALGDRGHVHLRLEVPVEHVAQLLAPQGAPQEESRQGAVVVELVLEHLSMYHQSIAHQHH